MFAHLIDPKILMLLFYQTRVRCFSVWFADEGRGGRAPAVGPCLHCPFAFPVKTPTILLVLLNISWVRFWAYKDSGASALRRPAKLNAACVTRREAVPASNKRFTLCTLFQEYTPTSESNLVMSLMRLVEMQMIDPCAAEDAKDNRHLKTWLMVCAPPSQNLAHGMCTRLPNWVQCSSVHCHLKLG